MIASHHVHLEQLSAATFPRWFIYFFSAVMLYGFLHAMEGAFSAYLLFIGRAHVSLFPFIGTEFEWEHYVLNGLYLVMLFVLFSAIYRRRGAPVSSRGLMLVIGSVLLIQFLHFADSNVRMYQHIETGCVPCKGVLYALTGHYYIHPALAILIFMIPFFAYVRYGFLGEMYSFVRESLKRSR